MYNGENFVHITEKEGLSNNRIWTILGDSQGNMWFGTWGGGVNIFNPGRFGHLTDNGSQIEAVISNLEDSKGNRLNPITGKLQSESDVDDTTQVRLGGEYLFIGEKVVIPLRAGVFYDPEPAEGSPDDFWGFSIGSGIAYHKFIFDAAYQYRFGNDIRTTTVGGEDSSQDVDQHNVHMSLIYHF